MLVSKKRDMLIEIKDLEIGDEILIPCQVDFKRLRVERKPVLRAQTTWNGGYKAIKCAVRNNNLNGNYSQYDCTNEDYNDTMNIDLNGRRIWLIKRKEKC